MFSRATHECVKYVDWIEIVLMSLTGLAIVKVGTVIRSPAVGRVKSCYRDLGRPDRPVSTRSVRLPSNLRVCAWQFVATAEQQLIYHILYCVLVAQRNVLL